MSKHYVIFALLVLVLSGCRSSIVDDPTILISFDVREESYVKLEVENSYNTVVAVLSGVFSSGLQEVEFDASTWVEGIYFYTIECKGTDSNYYSKTTRRMLLIK